MSVEYTTGNLLDSDAQALVNPVNCVGTMGAGLALAFKKRFPNESRRYIAAAKEGRVQLGRLFDCSIFELTKLRNKMAKRVILHLPTKQHWIDKSHLADVRRGIKDLEWFCRNEDIESVAIPKLGCGNGGLKWEDVKPLIEKAFKDSPVRAIVYE